MMVDDATLGIVAALRAGVEHGNRIARRELPDEWAMMRDSSILDDRERVAEAMGLRVLMEPGSLDAAPDFHIFPIESGSFISMTGERARDELDKGSKTQWCSEDRQVARGLQVIILLWILNSLMSSRCEPTFVERNYMTVEEVHRLLGEHFAAVVESERDWPEPDGHGRAAALWLQKVETGEGASLEGDRSRTRTRAGILNNVLRFLVEQGYVEVSEGMIRPTTRLSAAWPWMLASPGTRDLVARIAAEESCAREGFDA